MPKELMIIGASGHGKVVADIARQITENGHKRYTRIQFLDDDKTKAICGVYPVIGTIENIEQYLDMEFFIAIGDAKIREIVAGRLESFRASIPVLVHPSAIIGENVSIGQGSVVVGGAVINADASIGQYCIINTGATVDHDCVIGDYAHIAPGAHLCGGVHVGKSTWIGAGTTVVQEVHISQNSMIGAGSVVVHDLKGKGVYMGCPAKNRYVSSGGTRAFHHKICHNAPLWRTAA